MKAQEPAPVTGGVLAPPCVLSQPCSCRSRRSGHGLGFQTQTPGPSAHSAFSFCYVLRPPDLLLFTPYVPLYINSLLFLASSQAIMSVKCQVSCARCILFLIHLQIHTKYTVSKIVSTGLVKLPPRSHLGSTAHSRADSGPPGVSRQGGAHPAKWGADTTPSSPHPQPSGR